MAEEDCEVNVCVALRCRPMSNKELGEGQTPIAEFPSGGQQVVLTAKGEKHQYQFDHVFSPTTSQDLVFDRLGKPLLVKAFDGYNSTIFAYGQTGSGKTHTMMNHKGGPTERGLIPRINEGLFERIKIETSESETRRFLVCCSFLEIYNEIIFDLLVPRSKQKSGGGLEIREQKGIGVYVKDLTEVVVDGADKLNQMIEQGFENRMTAATKMNDTSSRSHCIFIIKLHQKDAQDESKNTFSKVNLVDLAGSERAKSTEAEGDRLKEGANINKSLSALGNVINALSSMSSGSKKVFVPYRNSKLTRVLQESLGGNSLCTMVAAMSPADANAEETLSTLNYARRAKTIKVTATKNEEASTIRKLEDEVSALKAKLEQQALNLGTVGVSKQEKEEIEAKYINQIEELQSFMKQSWQDKQNLSEQYEQEQSRAREQAKKAAEKVALERKRRLQLLASKGDLELTLQAINALESKLCTVWPGMIADALKAEQQVRTQLHAVKLFRDSATTDFNMIWNKSDDDSISITLLGQVHVKLGAMKKELTELSRLELQFEEKIGQVGPKVGLALREAQNAKAKQADDDGDMEDEVVELLELVQKQVGQHHEKARAFLWEERAKLGFTKELTWLSERLEGDGSSQGNAWKLVKAFREALQAIAAGSSTSGQSAGELPKPLGLSTLEWPDDRLSATSNIQASRCARLLQSVVFGGWCPKQDSEKEYLQVDLGKECTVAAISIQGRQPCSDDWSQTRDLLRLALGSTDETLPSGDKLPNAEKVYKRPPVRLMHDVGIALAHDKKCIDGWEVPQEFRIYGDMSRDQKIAFFEELIKRTNAAYPSLATGLTNQDILSGKNCEWSNRLLQVLSYLSLRTGTGLDDPLPQWTSSFKVEAFQEGSGWSWCSKGASFEGNSDESSVKYVVLPEAVVASQLRIHPVKWNRHAGLRCEIHVASKGAVLASSSSSSSGVGGSGSLEECVGLVNTGVLEVQKGIQDKQSAKAAEEESKAAAVLSQKDKAEQERDLLETRLQDALKRVEEIEKQYNAASERAASAETSLLELTVERDRLKDENAQLESELENKTQGKSAAEETMQQLKDEAKELNENVQELRCQVEILTEERDLARTKEDELFEQLQSKEEDLMDTNNGYVWLTERLAQAEEELQDERDQAKQREEGNQMLDDRCKELQDELMNLRVEHQKMKKALQEEEIKHKAERDRHSKTIKEFSSAGLKDTSTTSTSTREGSKPPQDVAEDTHYDDDFDEPED
mmetsp:Transcript_6651/g.10707  ORF Transcript_6651/g.10707 Transcript_6651/m.10707 type:complete len:1252 (-) Transcript_6651:88-3843(-)